MRSLAFKLLTFLSAAMKTPLTVFRLILALIGSTTGVFVVRHAYVTETWPETRTLTWARPGESGAYSEPANWLEKGKPATSVLRPISGGLGLPAGLGPI